MEEVLLMDAIVKPEVIPHNVSYGIFASILLIVVALYRQRFTAPRAQRYSEFCRNARRVHI